MWPLVCTDVILPIKFRFRLNLLYSKTIKTNSFYSSVNACKRDQSHCSSMSYQIKWFRFRLNLLYSKTIKTNSFYSSVNAFKRDQSHCSSMSYGLRHGIRHRGVLTSIQTITRQWKINSKIWNDLYNSCLGNLFSSA